MAKEKHVNFMIKHSTLLLEHAIGDHSKQIRPCLYMVQNRLFQFEVVIVEGGLTNLTSKLQSLENKGHI